MSTEPDSRPTLYTSPPLRSLNFVCKHCYAFYADSRPKLQAHLNRKYPCKPHTKPGFPAPVPLEVLRREHGLQPAGNPEPVRPRVRKTLVCGWCDKTWPAGKYACKHQHESKHCPQREPYPLRYKESVHLLRKVLRLQLDTNDDLEGLSHHVQTTQQVEVTPRDLSPTLTVDGVVIGTMGQRKRLYKKAVLRYCKLLLRVCEMDEDIPDDVYQSMRELNDEDNHEDDPFFEDRVETLASDMAGGVSHKLATRLFNRLTGADEPEHEVYKRVSQAELGRQHQAKREAERRNRL